MKVLYAAEDEKVEVSQSGELIITAPNGEKVIGGTGDDAAAAAAAPGADGADQTGGDEEMI